VDRIDDAYGLDGMDYRGDKVKAMVTIMKGCDHRCTYCIVPYTRGREVSRNSESILREMKDIEARGFQDVMLLGQNVNSYGKGLDEPIDFTGLLEKIQAHAPGIPRLRFTTSHPKDAHERLFRVMRDLPMVCEHLHLPVQSGSNAVLRRMKREHTIEWYRDQIAEYRALLPEGGLTTDLITGFPGETEADFLATRKLVEEMEFDGAFIFQYSPRPLTPALKLADDVPDAEKARRNRELLDVQRQVSLRKNQRWIGRTTEVLFENAARKGQGRFVGRTREYKRVVATSAEDLTGRIRRVRIAGTADDTLLGELLPA
jgi:tRNA-2-methylthio-N6-dimethylallyladenosine synthase